MIAPLKSRSSPCSMALVTPVLSPSCHSMRAPPYVWQAALLGSLILNVFLLFRPPEHLLVFLGAANSSAYSARTAGVPMPEIVEMGEWEDEAMARTYIRTLQAFAGERRNLSDVTARKRKASSSSGDADGEAAQVAVATADGGSLSPVRAVVAADVIAILGME